MRHLYEAEGGERSPGYTQAKEHFARVYSRYNQRAVLLAEQERLRLKDAEIDAHEVAEEVGDINDSEVDGENNWRVNRFHGWAEHRAAEPYIDLKQDTEIDR